MPTPIPTAVEIEKMTPAALIAGFNEIAATIGLKTVKRFESRSSGVTRFLAAIDVITARGTPAVETDPTPAVETDPTPAVETNGHTAPSPIDLLVTPPPVDPEYPVDIPADDNPVPLDFGDPIPDTLGAALAVTPVDTRSVKEIMDTLRAEKAAEGAKPPSKIGAARKAKKAVAVAAGTLDIVKDMRSKGAKPTVESREMKSGAVETVVKLNDARFSTRKHGLPTVEDAERATAKIAEKIMAPTVVKVKDVKPPMKNGVIMPKAARIRELIATGLNNHAIWGIIQPEYKMPDGHKGMVAFTRWKDESKAKAGK